MKPETNASLERRAAVHAALGDTTRLRIVDTLRLGDASPSELSTALSLPSNLLAFHLRTLESAGLVERHRSEGDRRRTYLRLSHEALDELAGPTLARPARVVFVCTANSARSQLAAALWRRASQVAGTSAGTHPAERIDPGAHAVARRHDLPLPQARPRHLDDVLADGDLVITVCDRAHEQLLDRRRLHWSIPDPVRIGTSAAFDEAYDAIAARVTDLADTLPSAS
jgi:ArsR family transcriptional regulator, arsenate/arsenite/antimonite-responsive transcriptional repressor / arsenate reductase (thioredoxin)